MENITITDIDDLQISLAIALGRPNASKRFAKLRDKLEELRKSLPSNNVLDRKVVFEVGLSDNGKTIRSVEFPVSYDTARVKIWISREMVDAVHGMCRGIPHYYIEGVCAQCGSKEPLEG